MIPAYRVAQHVEGVIARVPPEVGHIIVVDDASPDLLQDVLGRLSESRLIVLRHEVNLGVGAAMKTGFRKALELGADIIVKIDGDGQMDPALIPEFIEPIISGEADFTKGNRFDDLSVIRAMPFVRRAGNLALSFLVKLASGYWHAFDPTNGYVALRGVVLERISPKRLADRYFFEISLLCEAYFARAVLQDIPMKPVYADETSSLSPLSALGDFAPRLVGRSVKRIFLSYFMRDFNVVSVFLLAGVPALVFGIVWSAYHWIQSARLMVVAEYWHGHRRHVADRVRFPAALAGYRPRYWQRAEETPLMQGRRRYQWGFSGACVFALVILVGAYSNSFQNSFHFDDSHVVEGNLYIRSLNIPLFFRDASTGTSLPANAVYRPLVTTSLALDYWFGGGLNVRQFHRSQLAMFVLLSVAVFLLYLRLMEMAAEHWSNRWVALLAATLYSVHTTNTETLNLMHARSELLSGLGVVVSFLVYIYLPRSRRTYLYVLPMMIGALAKSPAVMFAPLFLVYLVLFEQRLSLPDLFTSRSWPRLREALWKSLPVFIVGVLEFIGIASMDAPTVNYGGGNRVDYLVTQPFVWLHYGRLFFLPMGLTADTDWTLIPNWYDTRVIAGFLFVALLFRILWTSSKVPSLRPVSFGLAWFALGLLPTSSIVPLAEVSNEHRIFFPYIGLALAVVWGLTQLVERWSAARPRLRPMVTSSALVLGLIAISGNVVATYERNKVWRTDESLWRDVSEKSPANGRGLMNYGLSLMSQGKYEDAKRLFDRALVYNPNYSVLQVNLGIVTDRLGQPALAESYFQRALQLGPNEPAPHFFYGRWLVEQGRSGAAIPHLERAIALSPGDVQARYLLLETYARVGSTGALKSLAVESLALLPGDQKVRQYLNGQGEAVVSQQRPPSSVDDTPQSLVDASMRLYQAGDYQGSLEAARKAVALKSDFPEAYNNIAAAYASMQRWDEAIQAAKEALRLKPDFPLARNNLAWAEAERRKTNK